MQDLPLDCRVRIEPKRHPSGQRPAPSADTDDPAGAFRVYLDQSRSRLLTAGFPVTNDPTRIDVHEVVAPFADGFESGDAAAWSATLP